MAAIPKCPDGQHTWKKLPNGDIDDGAFDDDRHNGPMCTNCDEVFCRYCEPERWKKIGGKD